MNRLKNQVLPKILWLFLIAILVSGIIPAANLETKQAFAHGGQNDECEDALNVDSLSATNGGSFSGNQIVYNASAGQIISGVCIKSGSGMFGDNHSEILGDGNYETNNCYTVSGVGTSTVTVTRNGSGNTCKELSHIDVYLSQINPSPSPSAQVSPSPSPSDQPSPSPSVSPSPSPSPSVDSSPSASPSPSPSPSISPSPQASPSPSPSSCNGICINIDCDGPSQCEVILGSPSPSPSASADPSPSSNPSPSSTISGGSGGPSDQAAGASDSTGQVLGVTSLAPTGNTLENLSNTMLILGLSLLTLKGVSYAQQKVKN